MAIVLLYINNMYSGAFDTRTEAYNMKGRQAMIQTLYTVNSYDEQAVFDAVSSSFDTLGIDRDLKSGMKVVIKPNLIMAKRPKFPATTHPAVINAVGRYLYEHGIEDITVAESSGGLYNAEHMKNVYRVCGLKELYPYIRLNMDFTSQTVNCSDGFANHTFNVITPITEADYIINVCKLKTHSMTGYSGGIKNLFGVIPGLEKPQLHYRWLALEDFSNMLLELAMTINPDVTVIDAIDAMEGNGPTGGSSHPLNMIMAARDFYTQDYFAAKLMGIEPTDIVMIRQAVERGLAKPDGINLTGDEIPSGLTSFVRPDTQKLDFSMNMPAFLAKPVTAVMSHFLKSYPKVNPDICIGCGKCAESCPPHIIKIKNKKAQFTKKGCISCFCCQEMCPVRAISVKKAL